ncbi:MarR family transcriptional regulator [Auritidibacter ignavus]|uniref:MarR family transcriptional regulator n=1 Tax=Auritidibacter ignavus TaxID=678932 RepID=A0AAJ6AKJ3_9MICC|nr:MarR family transcriptional regulator [Auritidibacter ignavus]WGH92588.1 MarR family transcriptional regulator [Auritidibacter ignavus]
MTDQVQTLKFVDRAGAYYAESLGFPPVAGRTLAYLAVCSPAEQTIADLADALLASRSAITQAVSLLSERGLARRFRGRGQRVDFVVANLDIQQFTRDLDGESYADQAKLLEQAALLLDADGSGRKQALHELSELYLFLAERLPELKDEWLAVRTRLREREGVADTELDSTVIADSS